MTPFDGSGKSNLSFSHNVFYLIDRNYHFCYTYFVVCKYFQFGLVQNFVVWELVNVVQVPTAMLVGRLGILTRTNVQHTLFPR